MLLPPSSISRYSVTGYDVKQTGIFLAAYQIIRLPQNITHLHIRVQNSVERNTLHGNVYIPGRFRILSGAAKKNHPTFCL